MAPSKEKKYLLVNRQTNDFVLPLYRSEEIVYEDLVEAEGGGFKKVWKKRSEPRGDGSVTLKGSHHRHLIDNPTKTLVNEATLEEFKKNPIFMDMVLRSLIQIEEAPAGWEPPTPE